LPDSLISIIPYSSVKINGAEQEWPFSLDSFKLLLHKKTQVNELFSTLIRLYDTPFTPKIQFGHTPFCSVE